jgi:hypothetical protein
MGMGFKEIYEIKINQYGRNGLAYKAAVEEYYKKPFTVHLAGQPTPVNVESIKEPLVWIGEIKENWKPKTKTETGYGYHGSSKGDEIEYTLYFDEYRCEWGSEDRAFQGFIFKTIDKTIKQIYKK